ncbi:hypothetical protein BCR43DRAFT_486835 [Syncephalastrum racemosum]|uniref:Uncharacterized protein n=1 Tax=Syncephalastrum racemosum TaxID=13706 RepID=A0A1X2HPQ5_SYNRA|nr:hypothetical protein BCR43DRAFT_486835 [Syncephalastrum racemosum]
MAREVNSWRGSGACRYPSPQAHYIRYMYTPLNMMDVPLTEDDVPQCYNNWKSLLLLQRYLYFVLPPFPVHFLPIFKILCTYIQLLIWFATISLASLVSEQAIAYFFHSHKDT